MRVFLDTNILLDVLGNRLPFCDQAATIWTLAEQRRIVAVISAVSLTNIFYIVRKLESRTVALRAVRQLRTIFLIGPCDERVIDAALRSDFDDIEDAVQHATAMRMRCECLVTRNVDHFDSSALPVLPPGEFLTRNDVSRLLS